MALSAETLEELLDSDGMEAAKRFLVVHPSQRREPLRFKVEWQGAGMIALSSKTYCGWGKKAKLSTKGLSKNHNDFGKEEFMDVLFNRNSKSGLNRGFRVVKGELLQYVQKRIGLSFMYCKRKVCADGISTLPLDL